VKRQKKPKKEIPPFRVYVRDLLLHRGVDVRGLTAGMRRLAWEGALRAAPSRARG